MNMLHRSILDLLILNAIVLCAFLACVPASFAQDESAESEMAIKAGEKGAAFESLTIEGEDRIHIEFDRPVLRIELNPLSVGGLDGDGMELMLARSEPDLVTPLLGVSASTRSPFIARPWFNELDSGGLVKFRPELEGVQSWSLLIADSRGDTVIVFSGKRNPPEEIEWDGRTRDGRAALPGLVYSYVLTAWDKAGNKRNFVGEGFELPAYRMDLDSGPMILFAARHLDYETDVEGSQDLDPPLLAEAASLLNQEQALDKTIRIIVKARDYDRAARVGQRIATCLRERVLGDPARIQTFAEVEDHAPEDGAVLIVTEGS